MKRFLKGLVLSILLVATFVPFINVNADGNSRVQVLMSESIGNKKGTFTVTGGEFDSSTNFNSSAVGFVDIGEDVTLSVNPNSGYSFVGWFVAVEGDNGYEATQFLSESTSYTFTVENSYYNIMPVFERQLMCDGVGHNNIWTVSGGEVAVLYEALDLDGTRFGYGEVVNYCIGDEITVIARANDGYHFVGWHITDPAASVPENYVRTPVVSTDLSYTYQPGVTMVSGYDEPLNYLTAVFEEDTIEDTTYTLDDGNGNQIIFADSEGIVFSFNSTDILNVSEEELQRIAADMQTDVETVRAMGEQAIENAKNASKGLGTLVGLYDFSVYDGNEFKEEATNGFKIRIKMTDAMKKYNDFYIAYLKNDGTIDEPIKLTQNGEYLEGVLPHLSTYAVIGNYVENIENPKTGDNIILYIVMLGLSTVGLIGIGIKKFN